MLNTSITTVKPNPLLKSQPQQQSLFGASLPLNIRVRSAALEQLENDFWMMLDAQTDKRKQKQHRFCRENFDRDFERAQRLGLKPSDIMSSIIGAMFEDEALIAPYCDKQSRKAKIKKAKQAKKGGK